MVSYWRSWLVHALYGALIFFHSYENPLTDTLINHQQLCCFMKNAPLTARYRPQSFAEVAGQETIKTILSRAAAEDKVAPAYLFSGTRGVGKTTIARIFAKALNCRKAPAAEPCNTCDLCRAVTQGAAIDVVEIDGASNRGIDDVRRLKEVVGYAPMDGRYKVFIIDEAHMLSRDAFNALLKTLEEPPAGVTFIMATTEPHKFPATVVSRCQHFVFKRLSEHELIEHLTRVLTAEKMDFEPAAVRLIARRGAGSVRDSMSLLGQVLALGADRLTQEATRTVLGLAGQETFMALLEAIRQGNTLELVKLLRLFLEQGLDIGFFLRELANHWREMFILCQSGEAGLEAVDLPEDEARLLLDMGQKFSLPHIHACWQMTLEGQRRVQTSLEPGLALELLLLNLAMLPQLMPLDSLSSLARRAQVSPKNDGGVPPRGEPQAAVKTSPPTAASQRTVDERASVPYPADAEGVSGEGHEVGGSTGKQGEIEQETSAPQGTRPPSQGTRPSSQEASQTADQTANQTADQMAAQPTDQSTDQTPRQSVDQTSSERPSTVESVAQEAVQETAQKRASGMIADASASPLHAAVSDSCEGMASENFEENAESSLPSAEVPLSTEADSLLPSLAGRLPQTPEGRRLLAPQIPSDAPSGDSAFSVHNTASLDIPASFELDDSDEFDEAHDDDIGLSSSGAVLPAWDAIVGRAQEEGDLPWFGGLMQSLSGTWEEGNLVLHTDSDFIAARVMEPTARELLEKILRAMMGRVPVIRTNVVKEAAMDKEALKEAVYENPTFKDLEEIFGVRLIDFGRIHK